MADAVSTEFLAMALTFEMREAVGVYRSEGDFDFREALRVFDDGLARLAAQDQRPALMLIDMRESQENRSSDQLRHVAEVAKKRLGTAKIVILTASVLHRGLGRMFGVFAGDKGLEVSIVESIDEGLRWLQSEED